LNNSLGAVLFIAILVIGLAAGWVGGSMNSFGPQTSAVTQTTITSSPIEPVSSKSVYLTIIPDWGGDTYDAFVPISYTNGTVPPQGSRAPNNNVTVPFGVPVTFVITNLDTAVLENYTGHASVDFTFYNGTDNGQVAVHYAEGAAISTLQIGHTFSIPSLNVDVPIPADTVVTFTYTFTTPGVYEYLCETPCGAGMGVVGYMNGYVIVG
jgi:plastocyanin